MELRPPLHFGVVAIEKGAFGLPSTKVANFILLTEYKNITLGTTNMETYSQNKNNYKL